MKKAIIILIILTICSGCKAQTADNTTSSTLIVEDGMIKYENNGEVQDIIALEDLLNGTNNTSEINSREIELFVENGYIVWNYIGETSVHKLVAIDDLIGEQGITGPKGETGENGATGPKGADGTSAYIWVKYLNNDPAQSNDADLKDETDNYMGIYYGTLSSAPDSISSYSWYNIKGDKGDQGIQGIQGEQGIQGVQGEKGEQGDAGTDAYVWIRYAETDPAGSTNVTLYETPKDYMGVYSGPLSTAPTDASEYNWFKIKGEQGEKGDQGDASVTYSSYFDNLAVVTCSIKGNTESGYIDAKQSCNVDFGGDELATTNNSDNNIVTINKGGNYLVELEANISYVATNTVTSPYLGYIFNYGKTGSLQVNQTFDNNFKQDAFYKKEAMSFSDNYPLPLGYNLSGISSYEGTLTIKFHKIS